MTNTSTYVRDPATGQFYSQGSSGMVPISDPSIQTQLSNGSLPYTNVNATTPTTPAPSNPISAGGLSLPLSGSMTPSTSTATNNNSYTTFNNNIASILAQIQKNASAGRANLGGAADALTTESVGAAGAYDPTATPGANLQKQQGTMGAFAPALTSINTQLQNANADITGLNSSIGTIQQANQPEVLSPGQSLVTKGGEAISQGHTYTPQINPLTGLVDGFDQNTGTWASAETNNNSSSTSPIESIFGSSNPMGAYAVDPNYVSEITGLYQTVNNLGVTQNADSLQQYITNNAKGSPITGQMILNAATAYGVDPALLTTILLHESDFGTAGAATKTNNPGNVGNTGSTTQTYNSWQQGVMAAAKNIAHRMASSVNNPATPSQPQAVATGQTSPQTSPVGGSFSDAAAQKISQLPSSMQSYVDAGPLGVAYINDDRVPANLKQSMQTLSAKAGIPYVSAGDVGAIKSIETVLNNLDSMQVLADENLKSGTLGHLFDSTIGQAREFLQTPRGIKLGLFDNYRDTAIKAVQALAGGSGSGLRINGAEIAANTQNLPKSSDSKENAIAQIKQLRQLIYTQMAATFPYAPVKVNSPDGKTGTIPASNLAGAISAGYTVS